MTFPPPGIKVARAITWPAARVNLGGDQPFYVTCWISAVNDPVPAAHSMSRHYIY
jgi:hypothetical protein